MIKLTPIASTAELEFGDASGYKFRINANLDPEWGWAAHITISSFGLKTQEDAIEALRPAVTHLLRMLNEDNGAACASPNKGEQNG